MVIPWFNQGSSSPFHSDVLFPLRFRYFVVLLKSGPHPAEWLLVASFVLEYGPLHSAIKCSKTSCFTHDSINKLKLLQIPKLQIYHNKIINYIGGTHVRKAGGSLNFMRDEGGAPVSPLFIVVKESVWTHRWSNYSHTDQLIHLSHQLKLYIFCFVFH